MKSILDKAFRYTPAARTDIRRTFARIRAEQREAEAQRRIKVTELKRKEAK